MTQCEIHDIAATVFVAYMNNWAEMGDIETLIGCEAVFDEPGLADARCVDSMIGTSFRYVSGGATCSVHALVLSINVAWLHDMTALCGPSHYKAICECLLDWASASA